MSDFICITNRKLCREPFIERVKSVAESKPKAIVLREKDLDESEYILLAADVLKIGANYFAHLCRRGNPPRVRQNPYAAPCVEEYER